MAKGSCSSPAPAAAAAATASSVDFPVFIDTNLDTHLAMIVTALDTVADFKRKILDEHPRCFPDLGQITIHAMKVWRKSCFYHLSDAMLVRSAFLGSKRAWFVQLDASSTCSTNSERGPTETFERSENGGQLQKSHLPSLDTGPSNLPDGQAVQTYSPVVNGSPEMNLLLPETNTMLVNNFQKVTSCDPIANVPSVPEYSSLPQVGNSTVENPTIVSNHQDGDVSKISTPEANDLNFELGAPLHTVKGSDHKVPEDFDLVNVGNEVSETHNPSKEDVMTYQREYVGNEVLETHNPSKDDVMTEREDVGNEVLETHNPSKDDVMTNQREDSYGDKETRVITDQDRSQLTDNYQSKKSTGDLQPEDNSRENIQVETKKRRKRKENDVIVEPVENPSEDVIADADLAEGSKIPQTDGPDKLSSLDASHDTQKSIETVPGVIAGSLVGGVDASEMGGSKVESKGDAAAVHAVVSGDKKAKKSRKRKENDVIMEPVENPSEDVIADADLAEGSKIPQTDGPDKLSSLDASHDTQKSIETVPGVIAGSLVGGVDANETGGSKVESKGDAAAVHAVVSGDKKAKKSRKRKENDVIMEPVENPSEDVIADADLAEGSKIPQTDEPDKLSSLDASHEAQKSTETVPGVIAGSLVGGVDANETGGSKVESKGDAAAVHAVVSGDKKAKKSRKRKENDVIMEPVENPSEDVIADADLAEGSKIPQTDEPDKLSSLDASHEAQKSTETVPGVIAGSLVGGVDASETGGSKVEGKGDAPAVQAVASGEKKARKSRKRRAARLNPSVVEEHENVTGDISPSVYESALPGDDLFGIHHHVEIGKGDNDLPMIKELKTMASEAKSCEDGVDSLKLPEATEATEMGDFGGKKGTRPKRSRASAAKSDASRSRIECVNDTVELASQKSNLHGLDDKNLNSRQHGIDETKEVENASSQTKLKTSQAESVNENEACPPKLDPMSRIEDTLNFKDEKGKRKSKRIRSNAKSFHDPSMELQDDANNTSGGENLAIHQTDENKKEAALPTNSENKQEDTALSRKRKKLKSDKTCSKNQLIESMLEEEDNSVKTKSSEPVKTLEPSIELQDGAHNTSGAGENLAIHQTDENKKEEALPAYSGNKKKVDTAMSRKSKKLKSDKTITKSQLAGSMLEGDDNGVKSKSSELVKTPRFEACPNGSPGEASNHDINFKEFFVPSAARSGDNAKELAATRKPHERTGKQDKKSNAEDPSLHLEKPPSSMDEKDKHVHHHDNGTSVVAGDGKKAQPDHRHDNSFAGPNGIKAMKSKIDDASAVHGSSKVSGKISQKKNIASEAASSVNTDCSEETIYVSKLGKKRPSRSNQYYVAVNKVPDKKLGEVLNNSDREKSSLATLDSIFEHVSGKSSEDEGGKIDSDATADISTDNSSSSAYSDGEDKRRPSNTPALKKRASLESPGTGPSIAHGGKNKKNDGNNIAMSQSADTGVKSRSIGMLLRKSSSYRKAKVTASQSRLEDIESQPVDMVPDSQAAHDFPEVLLSQ